jgi:Family of unknown function (DUF6152)
VTTNERHDRANARREPALRPTGLQPRPAQPARGPRPTRAPRAGSFAVAAAALAGAAAALVTGAALAHHSFSAEFDRDRPVELTGKVTDMRWANPHAWIYLDVESPDGGVVNWALESGAANSLIRRGWRREDLPVGTVLKIAGWQARNGSPTASVATVTFEDGRKLFAGTSNPDAPQQ